MARAKLLAKAGVTEAQDEQQGAARPHRVSQSVLQQIAKQQKLLQDAAAQQPSTESSADSQATVQQHKQAQEQKQSVQVDTMASSQPSGTSSTSVSVAAVDKVDFLLPTSHDQTGVHAMTLSAGCCYCQSQPARELQAQAASHPQLLANAPWHIASMYECT